MDFFNYIWVFIDISSICLWLPQFSFYISYYLLLSASAPVVRGGGLVLERRLDAFHDGVREKRHDAQAAQVVRHLRRLGGPKQHHSHVRVLQAPFGKSKKQDRNQGSKQADWQ